MAHPYIYIHTTLFFTAFRTELHWTDWVPGWRPFHTNLLIFYSQAEFQLTTELYATTNPQLTLSLINQVLHFTSLHLSQLSYTQPAWGFRYIASGRTQ
jgi:predicted membrane-bound dolichyl-phosphate-mannose-protein mannosyltransferase